MVPPAPTCCQVHREQETISLQSRQEKTKISDICPERTKSLSWKNMGAGRFFQKENKRINLLDKEGDHNLKSVRKNGLYEKLVRLTRSEQNKDRDEEISAGHLKSHKEGWVQGHRSPLDTRNEEEVTKESRADEKSVWMKRDLGTDDWAA